MASIRGISVEQYSESGTERGYYYFGLIIMDGTKIGAFENEGDGGSTDFQFDNIEYSAEFESRVINYFKEHPATLDDNVGFMLELIDLLDAEQRFTRFSHQLNQPFILIQANTYSRTSTFEDISEVSTSYHTIFDDCELEPLLEKIRPVEYFVYRNIEDFER